MEPQPPDKTPDKLWFFLGVLLFDLAMIWLVAVAVVKERWALPPLVPLVTIIAFGSYFW